MDAGPTVGTGERVLALLPSSRTHSLMNGQGQTACFLGVPSQSCVSSVCDPGTESSTLRSPTRLTCILNPPLASEEAGVSEPHESFPEPHSDPLWRSRVHLGPKTGVGSRASVLLRGPWTKRSSSGQIQSQASSNTQNPAEPRGPWGHRVSSRAPQRHWRTTSYSVTCLRKSSWEPTSKPRRFWKPRLEHSKKLFQMLPSGNCFVYKAGVWGQRQAQPLRWVAENPDTAGRHGRI